MISLVMPTFNRAHVLGRAVRSMLAQTHDDWELVIVDGASTDDTEAVVRAFGDPRIRLVRQPENTGHISGRNLGLDEARGEWLGMLDSDDELVPQALGMLMRALDEVDPELDAISCNCFDARTRRFTGTGLRRDGWLTVGLSLDRCRGEHWGIFRRRILGSRRFDERIRGYEGLLWYRIHDGARWYYLHRGLRIYHREGADRNSIQPGTDYGLYKSIFDFDPGYVTRLRTWSPRAYRRFNFNAAGQFLYAGDRERFERALANLRASGDAMRPAVLRVGMGVYPVLKPAILRASQYLDRR